jgi:pimeloyl-ACP methyl ester carboxylesterase
MQRFLWLAFTCSSVMTSCRCESTPEQLEVPAPALGVASGVTVDGCTVEQRQSCTAYGCSCLNGRCSGGNCPQFNDGCSGAQRNACSNYACGCLNERCSGGYCAALSDGCSDEMAKKCTAFGCGCANEQCSGGACPTLPDGCAETYRKNCALSGCGCSNNQCSGGACPAVSDGCEEGARRDCGSLGCSCWSGKCYGEACPSDISAPTQADTGPGSTKYPHSGYRMTQTGKSNVDSLIYEPTGPAAEKAPMVVMFHGLWPEARPGLYQPLAVHLARKGYLVILPLYGSTHGAHSPDIEEYAKDARAAIMAGIAKLFEKPDAGATRKIAFVGHAVGAMVALRLAQPDAAKPRNAKPPDAKLDLAPQTLVLHDPAGADVAKNWNPAGLSKIPAAVRLLIIANESSLNDRFSGASIAKDPWQRMPTQIKNVWVVRSDRRCNPNNAAQCVDLERATPAGDRNWSLVGTIPASGGVPESKHALNAIDWRGYWRLTEAALRTAFEQNPIGFDPFCRKSADPKCQTKDRDDMGQWNLSTGQAVVTMLLDADGPPVLPALEAAADGEKPKDVKPKSP